VFLAEKNHRETRLPPFRQLFTLDLQCAHHGMGQRAGMMLLWLSRGVFEEFVDAAGEVSFEAAADFSGGLAFGEAADGVGLGFGVAGEP
jgi:hypothetical protein